MIWAVKTTRAWARTDSAHRRGFPAIHALDTETNRVLCGIHLRDFDRVTAGARLRRSKEIDYVNCQRCLAALAKREEA